jgi:C4-dicarboxylate transporter DctM subunit
MGLLIGMLIFLIALKVPIAFALPVAAYSYLLTGLGPAVPLVVIPQRMFTGIDVYTYLAILLFILSGNIMRHGMMAERLLRLAEVVMARFTGGLAMTCAVACAMFGSITGSAPATTAAIGGATMPVLLERGYGREWSVAFIVAAGTIGTLIPPSIGMILFGAMTGTSIAALFLGGVVPGLVILVGLLFSSYFRARKMKLLDRGGDIIGFKKALREASWGLGMPVLILGGIFGGVFTPTEAAVVSVVYALIVCLIIDKTLSVGDLSVVFKESIITASMIIMVLACAAPFSWIITYEQGPQRLIGIIQLLTTNKYVILIMVNVFLLGLGCIIDGGSALIMTVPSLIVLGRFFGIDPVHLGVIVAVNLIVGMNTPPVGINLFTGCAVGQCEISKVMRPLLPMYFIMFLAMLITTYMPGVVLFLPRLVLY